MSRPVGAKPRPMAQLLDLHDALDQLARDGETPPCHDDRRFVADDRATRAEAARECWACPVVDLCREAGRSQVAGVWGGRDRDPGTIRHEESL